MSLPLAMVIDDDSSTALGIVRSLGQLGIPIIVGSHNKFGRACISRYSTHYFTYPKEETSIEERHLAIINRVKEWRPAVLMPIFEGAWSIIYTFYSEYSRLTTIVPNPGRELFDSLRNKSCLVDFAQEHAVPIPETFRPTSKEEALALRNQLPYPVLLKPKVGAAGYKIQRVNNAFEFSEALNQYQNIPIIQERIEGEDLELTVLCVNGESIAGSTYMSLRNYPPPFGPPVACRTIINDKLMLTGMEFLKKLKYNGPAHLDFRRDQRDGQVKLLDFNPRLAGTNCISICSGVNFPLILYRLALGEKIEPCFIYKEGVEYRWLQDIRLLVRTKNKSKIIKELLQWIFHRDHVFTEFSPADPLPHLIILNNLFKKLIRERKFWEKKYKNILFQVDRSKL